MGKHVVEKDGRKVGKVIGYTVMAGSFIIQQLSVKRPLLRSFGDTEMLIHRSQIVKVTDDQVVVKSATVPRQEQHVEKPVLQAYENPFRKKQAS